MVMKIYRVLWLLCYAVTSHAERVSLSFDNVPLPDLLKVVYAEVLRDNYVLSPDVNADGELHSMTLRDVDRAMLPSVMVELLKGRGYQVKRERGLVWVSKGSAEAVKTEHVYRPRYRSVEYLLSVLSPLFPNGTFAQQRSISSADSTPGGHDLKIGANSSFSVGGAKLSKSPGTPPTTERNDSGTSAYSLMAKKTDVLLFHGIDADKTRFLRLCDQLDIADSELLVKAVVFEVSNDKGEKSALSLAADLLNGRIAGHLAGSVRAGDFSAVFKAAGFTAVFDALASDRRFKVVSSPLLRMRSGNPARLVVGSETPVLGAASLDKNGNPVQSVDYRQSGVILDLSAEVRQEVSDLSVSQQISNFIPTSNGVNTSPTLIKRELSTAVSMRSGDVLVLGGLDETKETREKNHLPFVPWFQSEAETTARTEVIVVLEVTKL